MKSLVGKIVFARDADSYSVGRYIVLNHIAADPYFSEELGLMPFAYGPSALQYIVAPLDGDEAWELLGCYEDDLEMSDILDSISQLFTEGSLYNDFEFLDDGMNEAVDTGLLLARTLQGKGDSQYWEELSESIEFFHSAIREEEAPEKAPEPRSGDTNYTDAVYKAAEENCCEDNCCQAPDATAPAPDATAPAPDATAPATDATAIIFTGDPDAVVKFLNQFLSD